MKIGILTLPNSVSFGASLQTYALQYYLNSQGYDTEVINYLPLAISKEKSKNTNVVKRVFYNVLTQIEKNRFKNFEKEILKFPRKPILKEELPNLEDRYQYFICGSDQIWNPQITGNDYSYFFDFLKNNNKKIAYAPSFGISKLPESFAHNIQTMLCNFKRISVREKDGYRLVKELTDIESDVVMDPTFLIERDKWSLLEKKVSIPSEGYVLLFMLNPSVKMVEFAEKISKDKKIKLVRIGGPFFKRGRYQKFNYNLIGPRQWLYLFENADYIVTNSFHGIAFSLIFNKQFYTEYSAITNSRIEEMIKKFDLGNQLLSKNEKTLNYVDYSMTNRLLDENIKFSKLYLKNTLVDIQ